MGTEKFGDIFLKMSLRGTVYKGLIPAEISQGRATQKLC